jgi:hypothetical protein
MKFDGSLTHKSKHQDIITWVSEDFALEMARTETNQDTEQIQNSKYYETCNKSSTLWIVSCNLPGHLCFLIDLAYTKKTKRKRKNEMQA